MHIAFFKFLCRLGRSALVSRSRSCCRHRHRHRHCPRGFSQPLFQTTKQPRLSLGSYGELDGGRVQTGSEKLLVGTLEFQFSKFEFLPVNVCLSVCLPASWTQMHRTGLKRTCALSRPLRNSTSTSIDNKHTRAHTQTPAAARHGRSYSTCSTAYMYAYQCSRISNRHFGRMRQTAVFAERSEWTHR